jgi:hypothetical protein
LMELLEVGLTGGRFGGPGFLAGRADICQEKVTV